MEILADENIPLVQEAFEAFGQVRTMPGRAITAEALGDAEILLVRSITKVNEALLADSKVRFVATATIGEDHIDKQWLAAQGIGFCSAPGCNAKSVAEYIVAALLVAAEAGNLDLPTLRLGVVGYGNVGSRVTSKARAIGMEVVVSDAPLAGATCEPFYRPIAEVFRCDVVTLHVPLEKGGPYSTHHMANEAFFSSMKPGSIFINTSRGAVADNKALLKALRSGHLGAAILDVFENEPTPMLELVEAALIATPHIAGYSYDGKIRGTELIREGACRFFKMESTWNPAPLLPAPEHPHIALSGTGLAAMKEAVETVYAIREDDAQLREILSLPDAEQGPYFDQLRKNYPRRREFQNSIVQFSTECEHTRGLLRGIGFHAPVAGAAP